MIETSLTIRPANCGVICFVICRCVGTNLRWRLDLIAIAE